MDLAALVGVHQVVGKWVVRDISQCTHFSVIMVEVIESVKRNDGIPIDFLPMGSRYKNYSKKVNGRIVLFHGLQTNDFLSIQPRPFPTYVP